MPISRSTFFLAVHVFFLKNDQVLLTRRFQTGYEDGNYSVPAGHIESGETPIEAAIREAREEIGVTIAPENLSFAHVMHRLGHRQSVDFFFICRQWIGEPCIAEPDKCDDILWVKVSDLPFNTIEYIRLALTATQNNRPFSEANC